MHLGGRASVYPFIRYFGQIEIKKNLEVSRFAATNLKQLPAEALSRMIVDDAYGLHPRIDDNWSDEFEPTALQLF